MTTTTTTIEIATPEGPCTTEVVTPEGSGPWPAIILFTDAMGLRSSQTRIAERIAANGYVVLEPDPYHHVEPISALVGTDASLATLQKALRDPDRRAAFMANYHAPALDYTHLEKTIGAVLDTIAARPDFAGRVGTTGYCMGGNASVRAATIFGDRIAATAAFHPGRLVTDQPDSPHLRVGTIKSRLYLAPAIEDLSPEAEAALRRELEAAQVRFEIEPYDANHGYAVEDALTYDPIAAQRHYAALERFYRETLHS